MVAESHALVLAALGGAIARHEDKTSSYSAVMERLGLKVAFECDTHLK